MAERPKLLRCQPIDSTACSLAESAVGAANRGFCGDDPNPVALDSRGSSARIAKWRSAWSTAIVKFASTSDVRIRLRRWRHSRPNSHPRRRAYNQVTGPAGGSGRHSRRVGPLYCLDAHGLASWRLQSTECRQQNNSIGAELVPGATNRLLYAQPTNSPITIPSTSFPRAGELRAEAGLPHDARTRHVGNRLVGRCMYETCCSSRGPNALSIFPTWDLSTRATNDLLVHNFFCGIEMVR